MGLMPDKPNPKGRSFAQPSGGTRRCTKCLRRKTDDEFRWLNRNIRKASRCKACEAAITRAAKLPAPTPSLFDQLFPGRPRLA
jgi:hypothetical protein